ncbi:MAG: hypothetical protein OMOMHJEC_00864 [Xanthomonadales bacterium]|nr:hypothetical protein [Xanthomonadales bacterium]
MTMLLTLIAVMAAALASLSSWRRMYFLIIVIAAVQDPLRKITPGTPGWFTLLSLPVFFSALLASRAKIPGWWAAFKTACPSITKGIYLLCLLVIPAVVISVSYSSGSWQYTLLGLTSYSLIFLSIIAGFHFGRSVESIRKLIAFYVGVHALVLVGGVIQYLGMFEGLDVIGDRALGHEWLRWIPGYVVHLISGFYRSADVMGWHAATVCMLALILAFSETGKARWFWTMIAAWAVFGLFLCGRRKMVFMLPIFLFTLTWVYFYFGRAARVLPMIGFLVVPAASVYFVSDFLGEESAQIQYYSSAREGDTAFDRLSGHGFNSVLETVRQAGFFGHGLGFATPGSHHIGAARPRIWQESGTSRIMVELGVPGFVGFVGTLIALVVRLWSVTRMHLRRRTPAGIYAAGLFALFLANLGSLTVSGQILADSFIVIFLGSLVGIGLGFARPTFMNVMQTRQNGGEAGYSTQSLR